MQTPQSARWLKVLLLVLMSRRQAKLDIARYAHQLRLSRQRMLEDEQEYVALVSAAIVRATSDHSKGSRRDWRSVRRAAGKWRGSTLAGYLLHGDDITYKQNFRMSRQTFDHLLELLSKSSFATVVSPLQEDSSPTSVLHSGTLRSKRSANMRYARMHTDPPTTRFKLGLVLYAMGQGGRLKVAADVGSVGESTLRRWVTDFCDAVITVVKPVYMPGNPWSSEERATIQSQFASRRGIQGVCLACDGTHVPFRPTSKSVAIDYRNYKGWYSILCVAFVDSYYRFFDVHVGFPGRAGDNTVLRHHWLMRELSADTNKWLGENGIILGDSGASDGDNFFLNPYQAPREPDACWFNFCHSSTRFFC